MNGVFITGTDTNIGKTVFSSILCRYLSLHGQTVRYFKPIQTGSDEDCKTVAHLSGLGASQIDLPTYQFPEPISPDRAASLHQKSIDISKILERVRNEKSVFHVIEGAGGVLVPINPHQTMLDLIAGLSTRALVVAGTRLGTINHTLLTLSALTQRKIEIAGLVLMGETDPGLAEVIKRHSGVKILAEIPHFSEMDSNTIKNFCEKTNLEPLLHLSRVHS